MTTTWLFAVVLVRIPTTRRICLAYPHNLTGLCWTFCLLWVAGVWYHDSETAKAWSDFPKKSCRVLWCYIYAGTVFYAHVEFLGRFEVEGSDYAGLASGLGHGGTRALHHTV
ncbi:hypothetical protein BDR07DRAFT_1438818 [Suillus spraguei]|nr:hypothetical protein BDR07DRAFT_1438818 [Suillus spraguei]